MPSNSGAGAAVSSGASFQARVAGYVIVTAICDAYNDLVPDSKMVTIGFETTESIDDINIQMADGSKTYIQAKTRITYSLSTSGQLQSVVEQFYSQQKIRINPNDKFVLVTTSRSSKKITYDLRTALNSFRISPDLEFFRDQPKALTRIIYDLRNSLKKLGGGGQQTWSNEILDQIIRKFFVHILDVEEGDSIEQALQLLLEARDFTVPSAIWGKIVADCVVHSKSRHTIKFSEIALAYDKFRIEEREPDSKNIQDIISVEIENMNLPVGKEVILCRVEEHSNTIRPGLAIFELVRFNDDCSQRITFSEDTAILPNGLQFPLILRAATVKGLMRIIDADGSIVSASEVTVCPLESDVDLETGLCANDHRERLKVSIQQNDRVLYCVHCGNAVWEEDASIVESGPTLKPIVGLSHARCLVSNDRIFGRAMSELFRKHPELINFDVNAWFRASHGGQMAFDSARSIRGPRTPIIAWGGLNPSGPIGQYVVEISLSGGGHEIVTKRNGVHRLSKAEAEDFVSSLNATFKEARAQRDPLCYSDESKAYGSRSLLIEQLGGRERIIEVSRARVRRYEERFASRFSRPGQWYAPILYLRSVESGEPLLVRGSVVVLTDPLKLGNFLSNWRQASIEIADYETASILSDEEFDDFMRWIETRYWKVVADPILQPSNGALVSGYRVGSVESLVEERS